MEAYLNILNKVDYKGEWVENRTGIRTQKLTGCMFEHDMRNGFPLLTSKFVSLKNVAVELEGFIKGITSKKWFQERGCHVWDQWCNPEKVTYSHTDKRQQKQMLKENDLGPIYGYQWRSFNGDYTDKKISVFTPLKGVDQLKNLIRTLEMNPLDRRMIVSAWNPQQLDKMALPPCHLMFQVLCNKKHIDLIWYQRSCDMFLGVPYNIASYGLLLELIGRHTGFIPRELKGVLADVHIYENHKEQVSEQLSRNTHKLPTLRLNRGNVDMFDWKCNEFKLLDYKHHPAIKAPVAV